MLIHEITLQVFAALGVAKLRQSLGLDLSDTFACYAERAADFFQGAWTAVVETEAKSHDLLLTRRQLTQDLRDLHAQHLASRSVSWPDRLVVFHEIGQAGIVLIADRRVERERILGNFEQFFDSARFKVACFGEFLY